MPITPEQFIQKHTKIVEPLNKQIALNFWKAAVTGKTKYFKTYARMEKKMADIFSNKKEFKTVEGFKKSKVQDPILRRQIDLIHKSYKTKQGDKAVIRKLIDKNAKLEQAFNTFRANYKGEKVTENKIKDILKETKNSKEAENAWDAGKQIGNSVAKKILEIVELRNKLAKQLGYKNYYAMSFDLQELNEKEMYALFDKLEKLTREPFLKLKKGMDKQLAKEFKISEKDLRPWHYRDPFFQQRRSPVN